MLKIVTVPNSILTTLAKKVERFDDVLTKLVKDMDQTLRSQVNPQGVGLAAPQVSQDKAIFIIRPTPEAKTEVFVNPRIIQVHPQGGQPQNLYNSAHPAGGQTKKKAGKKTKLEGCLSIPKIWGKVNRSDRIFLKYQDLNGKTFRRWFSGFKAMIVQHEIDHLKGILFTQRALEQNSQLFEEKEGELMKIASI